MYNYNEVNFLNNILSIAFDLNLFDEVKNILIDTKIVVELSNNRFTNLNPITLKEVVKIEQIMGKEIIKIPTKKEWFIISRRKKLEQLKNISDNKSWQSKLEYKK